jgi:hypothetical protein
MNSMARRPGSSFEPDSIADSVSSKWCLARSVTAAGSARRGAAAMYVASVRISGEMTAFFFFMDSDNLIPFVLSLSKDGLRQSLS